jgi:hypothetical protein
MFVVVVITGNSSVLARCCDHCDVPLCADNGLRLAEQDEVCYEGRQSQGREQQVRCVSSTPRASPTPFLIAVNCAQTLYTAEQHHRRLDHHPQPRHRSRQGAKCSAEPPPLRFTAAS